MRKITMKPALIMLFMVILGVVFIATGVSFAQHDGKLPEDSEASSPKPKKEKTNLHTDLKISPPQPFFET